MRFSENYYGAMDPQYSSAMSSINWANYYLGAPTSAATPFQLQEVTKLANTGMQNVEVGTIDPMMWETIPKQHFEEMRQLAKVAGVKLSVHAPIVDPSGFTENKWGGEETRRQTVEQFKDVMEKSAELGPNVPVTVHGSRFPSTTWKWEPGAPAPEKEVMYAVDPETGAVQAFEKDKQWVPELGKEVLLDPDSRLRLHNQTILRELKKSLTDYGKEVAEAQARIAAIDQAVSRGEVTAEQAAHEKRRWEERAGLYAHYLDLGLTTASDKIAKVDPAFAQRVSSELQRIRAEVPANVYKAIEKEMLFNAIAAIPEDRPPQFFRPIEEFTHEKASQTFAEMAFHGFKAAQKRGIAPEKAPIVSVENWHPTYAMGRGEDLKDAIKKARNRFANMLVEREGLSASRANAVAEKLIGATWDVGHMNIFQRYGWDPEKLKTEMSAIAKDVKHVHLTDNFGFADVHLAPGMGNVPFEEFTDILKKEGKIGKVRGIVEAPAVVQHFKTDPHGPTLQYFKSPVYAWQTSPTWDEVRGSYFFGSSGYSAGYGSFLPESHFSMYGAGFSQLPTALGAPMPGQKERSKFAGTPLS